MQSRVVICVDANETQSPSKNCSPEMKPTKLITCENRECLPQWTAGYWSEVFYIRNQTFMMSKICMQRNSLNSEFRAVFCFIPVLDVVWRRHSKKNGYMSCER